MEERIRISMLLDYYSELLTVKQKNIMDLYFNNDLSLSEISQITDTSRQAIHDVLKRSCTLLEVYEKKLKLLEKSMNREKLKYKVLKELDMLFDENNYNSKISNLLEELKYYINNIV